MYITCNTHTHTLIYTQIFVYILYIHAYKCTNWRIQGDGDILQNVYRLIFFNENNKNMLRTLRDVGGV